MTTSIKQFLRTPKGALLPIFVALFGIAAGSAGVGTSIPHMLAAIVGAVLAELGVDKLDRRPFRFPSSALLSGMIVGFVLAPVTPWVVTVTVGILATLSKHIFATSRWHLFNPAALALLAVVPIFGPGQSWWGALPDLSWPWLVVLIAAGAFIVDRINKFPLVLAFLATLFALLIGYGHVDPTTSAELLRPPFLQATLFMAFFMLTDPPTAPSRYLDQVLVGVIVAVASVVAEMLGAGQTYLLVGLLIGNVVLAVRRMQIGRRHATRIPTLSGSSQVVNVPSPSIH